jgi:hypothetical protein
VANSGKVGHEKGGVIREPVYRLASRREEGGLPAQPESAQTGDRTSPRTAERGLTEATPRRECRIQLENRYSIEVMSQVCLPRMSDFAVRRCASVDIPSGEII